MPPRPSRAHREFDLAGSALAIVDGLAEFLAALRGQPRDHGGSQPVDEGLSWGTFRGPAEFALWGGLPRAARDAVRGPVSTLREGSSVSVRMLGWACTLGIRAEASLAIAARAAHDETELDEAHGLASDLLNRLRRLTSEVGERRLHYSAMARSWLALGEAEFARLEGRPDPSRWAAAAEALSTFPYLRAYALLREGEAALARGDARAGSALAEARTIATALGAEPLGRTVSALATVAAPDQPGRAAVARRDSGLGPHPDLTAREREVLGLLAAGRSDRQIGEALFISKKTASVHVASIKAKLGAQSRVEIAVIAVALGLAQPRSRDSS